MKSSFFEFGDYKFDSSLNRACFNYRLGEPQGDIHNFTEILSFPLPISIDSDPKLIDKAMKAVHLALGISYYKLFCPTDIRLTSYKLSKQEADFWKIIYRDSEIMQLYYGFNLTVDDKGEFPFDSSLTDDPAESQLEDRALILFGGGKDSLLTYDIVNNAGEPTTFFDFGRFALHDVISDALGVNRLVVERQIDEHLIEMTKRNDVFKGRMAHVPIPTMIAFVAVLTSVLYGYKYIVFSNEESAEYGNIDYLGHTVNHQWSKSKQAEVLIHDYIKNTISKTISCFSMLRPLHEIEIVRRFAKLDKYHKMFSSCNRNFIIANQDKKIKLWCCQCEKCAFVFALFSAFIPKNKMIDIFGENLYDKTSLVQTFKDLIGEGVMKPLECVGTPEETIVAMYMAYMTGRYEGDKAIEMFRDIILSKNLDFNKLKDKVFAYGDDSLIPNKFRKILHEN